MDRPLTQREQNLIDYHRSMLRSGKFLQNDDGSITTFRGTRFDSHDQSNPNAQWPGARAAIAPSYWDGQVLDLGTPAGRSAFDRNIKRIQYPSYPNDILAEEAENRLHKIMARDTELFQQARRPPMTKLLGVKK